MFRAAHAVLTAGLFVVVVATTGCSEGQNLMQPTAVSAQNGDQTASHGGSSGGSTTPSSTPLVVSTTSMPSGSVGASYTAFITSSGGQGTPHTFSLAGGQMPPGLKMASSYGVQSTSVTGTPSATGTWSFTVQVRDQTGHTATHALSITINGSTPVSITNQSDTLIGGTVGASYATNLFASGGSQP